MKKNKYPPMSPGLFRQRRNLIVMSIIIMGLATIDFDFKKITIFGVEGELKSSGMVYPLIIGMFLYFLMRYWTYFYDEKYIEHKDAFSEIFIDKLKEYCGYSEDTDAVFNDSNLHRRISIGEINLYQFFKIKKLYIERFNNRIKSLDQESQGLKRMRSLTLCKYIGIWIKTSFYLWFFTKQGSDYSFPIIMAFFAWPLGYAIRLLSYII
jgi:hypothetical protein